MQDTHGETKGRAQPCACYVLKTEVQRDTWWEAEEAKGRLVAHMAVYACMGAGRGRGSECVCAELTWEMRDNLTVMVVQSEKLKM